MQIAAALGPRSTEVILREVSGLPEEVLQRSLVILDRSEFLVKIDIEPDGLLEFFHEMVRQRHPRLDGRKGSRKRACADLFDA